MELNGIQLLFVAPTDHTHYGLPVVKIGDEEYAVADSVEQAQKAAADYIEQSVWAFRASFIGSFLELSEQQIKAIEKMQCELCEDSNDILLLMLGNRLGEFVEEAIDADGRGAFLNPYDGAENDGDDVSPALEGKLVYRID